VNESKRECRCDLVMDKASKLPTATNIGFK